LLLIVLDFSICPIVIPVVVGSIPISHPIAYITSTVIDTIRLCGYSMRMMIFRQLESYSTRCRKFS